MPSSSQTASKNPSEYLSENQPAIRLMAASLPVGGGGEGRPSTNAVALVNQSPCAVAIAAHTSRSSVCFGGSPMMSSVADHTKGRIEVGLDERQLDADAARALGALPAGRYAHLWVSDTGAGMDAATRERMFEPFFTTKAIGEGTGLGLSVVHGIVIAQHGGIGVTSAPGEGTTVDLYLPAREPPPARPAGASAPNAEAARSHGERVLYVDDDEVLRL